MLYMYSGAGGKEEQVYYAKGAAAAVSAPSLQRVICSSPYTHVILPVEWNILTWLDSDCFVLLLKFVIRFEFSS